MSAPLAGKTMFISGASRGIGLAIAKRAARDGANIAVAAKTDSPHPKLEGTIYTAAAEIEAAGGKAIAIQADLSQGEERERLVAEVNDQFGALDILVNNAGLTRDMLALRMGDADWAAVLEVDLTAPFRLARAALRGMMKRRAGRIVSIASIVGVTGNAGQANYAAAKAGLIGMTKTIGVEIARRGVTVNAVAPGFIETEMTADIPREVLEAVPARRAGRPDEVAAAVRFLASDAASYVTATTLFVDGGMSA